MRKIESTKTKKKSIPANIFQEKHERKKNENISNIRNEEGRGVKNGFKIKQPSA